MTNREWEGLVGFKVLNVDGSFLCVIVWLFNCVDFFVGKYGIYHACDVLLEKIGCQGTGSLIKKTPADQVVQVNYFFTAGIPVFRNIPVSGFNFMTPPLVEPMLERKHQRCHHFKSEFSMQCWNIQGMCPGLGQEWWIYSEKKHVCSASIFIRKGTVGLAVDWKVLGEAAQFWEKYQQEFNCSTVSLLYPSFLLLIQGDPFKHHQEHMMIKWIPS